MGHFFRDKENNIIEDNPQATVTTGKKISQPATPNLKTKSIANFFLALAIGTVAFVPIFFLMFLFGRNFERPNNFVAYYLSPTDWFFWVSLFAGLLFAVFILKVADKVAEEKGKYSRGIPYVLLILVFIWVYSYYFMLREDRKTKDRIEKVSEKTYSNPYRNLRPSNSFFLERGQESQWMSLPGSDRLRTWGAKGHYDIIFENGSIVSVVNGKSSPNNIHYGQTRFKIRSWADNQQMLIYIF